MAYDNSTHTGLLCVCVFKLRGVDGAKKNEESIFFVCVSCEQDSLDILKIGE